MTTRIFITATNTDVGKTHTTLQLMHEAAALGLRPAAYKPIETGVTDRPLDATKMLEATRRYNLNAKNLTIGDIVGCTFALPAAPYVAKGEASIDFSLLKAKAGKLENLCDVLFIEGAGGLMVPIDSSTFMIDLIRYFGATALLVAPSRLGSINDTLLSAMALRQKGLPYRLAINLYEDEESFAEVTQPYYDQEGIDYALLPRDLKSLMQRLARR